MNSNDPNHQSKKASRALDGRQRKIGNTLKQLYEDVANEPVPDDFMKLLEEADQNSSDDSSG